MVALERRVKQVLAFALLAVVVVGTTAGCVVWHEATWERVEIKWHSITSHSLGRFDQGETVRAKVVIDEGSVKVLEGRFATLYLMDGDGRAAMELHEPYEVLDRVEIDTKETDRGSLSYEAHATGAYYLVYRNDDFWNLTFKVADGDTLVTQLFIKVLWLVLFVITVTVFGWAYGRAFDVPVRRLLGLVRRERGPGADAAREPEPSAAQGAEVEGRAGQKG